jgi:hypothetical protein
MSCPAAEDGSYNISEHEDGIQNPGVVLHYFRESG